MQVSNNKISYQLVNYNNILTIEPTNAAESLVFAPVRMTVYDILEYLASGMTEQEILEDFPYLTEDDIIACLVYGVDGEDVSARVARLQYELAMKKTPQERV